MNNDFLRHLQSITPQGKAEEKKIFIPADKFKEMENTRDESEELDESLEQLDELNKKTYASYIRKAARDLNNMGYADGWRYGKKQFTGAKSEYGWQTNLQNARQRKTKNRKRGIDLATASLSEATRSKYLKLKFSTKGPYGNKVTDDTIELARKKLDAAILRRGGASPEAIKRGVANPFGHRDHEVDMAKYRFGNKRAKHLQTAINAYNDKAIRAAIKASKKAKVNEEELGEQVEGHRRPMGPRKPKKDKASEKAMIQRLEAARARGAAERAKLKASGFYRPGTEPINEMGLDESAYKKGKKILKRIGRAIRSPRHAGSILGYNR
jgi:hypothetical protein